MTIFGTGDYSYNSSSISARVSLPSSLYTSSTCFTSRMSSSTITPGTSFSRFDRASSTPLRSMRSESPGFYYNRAVSEFSSSYSNTRDKSQSTFKTTQLVEKTIADKMKSPKLRTKMLNSTISTSNRFSYPLNSNTQKDHMARYSQRITDIFEKEEDDKEINNNEHSNKLFSKYTATQNRAFSVFVPKSNYRSVLEDTKILEAKYKKMNDDVEEKRPKTDLDYLRPKRNFYCSSSFITPMSKENSTDNKPLIINPEPSSKRQTFSDRTMELYREAATPNPRLRAVTHSNHIINPIRYLAANLRTAIYNRSSISPEKEPKPISYKLPHPDHPADPNLALTCGLRRRYTNRETRLAKQTLEYIMKGERWTSAVERPFVLGI